MPTLSDLNAMPAADAAEALLRCFGSRRWVEHMVGARPFASREALLAEAERAADALGRGDWLEAFSHHPRIGGVDALRAKFSATRDWSMGEQAGAAAADEAVLAALAEGNDEYDRRFGHIFIVCATGKTAAEMLALLKARVGNDAATELAIAAGEQRKIARIRLEKLLA